jgi:hypothetical protein
VAIRNCHHCCSLQKSESRSQTGIGSAGKWKGSGNAPQTFFERLREMVRTRQGDLNGIANCQRE